MFSPSLPSIIVAGWRHLGCKKTLLYIPVGYALAWVSEFSSIHWGFPYGDYFYIQSTDSKELWVSGGPVHGLPLLRLSFYCSYSLAVFLMSPLALRSGNLITLETSRIRRSLSTLFLGAFFFVFLTWSSTRSPSRAANGFSASSTGTAARDSTSESR